MSENKTPSEIVRNRISGLSTSIGVRMGQIKTTIKNASGPEKELIADMLKTVALWNDELIELCYVKSVKTGFTLESEPESPAESTDSE